MKGFITPIGCEAESNDGKSKYILRKVIKFPSEGMEQTVYNMSLFVRMEGNSWEQTTNGGQSFLSVKDFIKTIANAPEMSQAYRDLSQYISE